jgi:NIMA (never in mitosis gene a)-related kinase
VVLRKHGLVEIKKVGEGSFGLAILVESEADKSRQICKMIDLRNASSKEAKDAHKESQLLASLKHPYIVQYRESFVDDKWLAILMDYCEGGDLSARIEHKKKTFQRFSEEQVLRWFTQAILALKYVHERHVLHRDLKSSNFFITKEGNLKVGDFGIAKVLNCTVACAKTQIGTPYYLSPEVCQEKPYNWASDIWAMGCVLYELCALKVPFDAPNLSALVQRICCSPLPHIPNHYSQETRQLGLEMLNRCPEKRPGAADILQRALIQSVVRKLLSEAQGAQDNPKAEGQGSPATPSVAPDSSRPVSHRGQSPGMRQAPPAPYKETAGTFLKGDKIEYWSESHKEWLPATVVEHDSAGQIRIDLKPGQWLDGEVQSIRVRQRPSEQIQRRPSGHGAPGSAAYMRCESPMRAGTPGRRPSAGGFPPSRGGTPMRQRGASPLMRPGMPRLPASPAINRQMSPGARDWRVPNSSPTPRVPRDHICRQAGMAIIAN